ncbi:MAG: penicillin-binding protein 2 [Candidatus Cryptobacteroides sp.]|nr:penicillin-binding protein 2 [Bacteroidales bacterium]MDY2859616.1 penicillin-binding protein 2 [Candidatus Cryptobacteroides sp.]MDY3226890.1 penicillin-binding protein 2 [Candidatus Cryptobacteroides sp.]MDY5442818.1 penicillin-binding protein 2 [Candidatus Cryptobacteroides sp.]
MKLERANKLRIGLLIMAGILIAKIFYIQIIDDRYKIDASNNSMVYDIIYPTRGVIYDRNGKIIVGNKVAYDILVTPKEVTEFDTLLLASVLEVEPDFIRSKMAEYRKNRRRIGYQSVIMMKQLSAEKYMKFSEIQYKFPGFRGQVRSIRDYPFNAGGNLLGYVSEVDQAYISRHPGEYRPGDYAGKTGLEAAREADLKGEKGYHIYLRNSHNQIQTRYKDGEMDKEAIPGKDIVTTIDADLQQYGQLLMQNKVGSLVAIEPSTGEILTMVSSPGIDVEMLADIGKHYKEIVSDPHKPMFNRAVQAPYPPGSVFKLVNGLIGLEEGVLKPEYTYPCNKGYYFGKHKLGCHAHRSPLDLEDAIMMSCNGYFCYVMRNILENRKYRSQAEALDKWHDYVSSFGFGHKLGSDFPAELGGTIPTSNYYNKIYGKGGWKFTTVISISIGQGEIGVTPLQIANMCATVANRGYYYIPHIVKDSDSLRIDDKFRERQYTMVDTTNFKKVIKGMWKAVNSGFGSGGTASIAAVEGLDICGKTGTAQNPRGADNSVFICFAPMDNPKIAVAAYVENAGFGATWSAPIASLLVEKYLTGQISDKRKPLEERMLNGDLMSRVKTY